jgi:hypothetical protein
VIIDGDVQVVVPDLPERRAVVAGLVTATPHLPSAAGADLPELLHVDVHELAGTGALVAARRLEPQAAKLAHPDPGEDAGHGRQGHPQHVGDLGSREAQPAQGGNRLDTVLGGAVGHPGGGRGVIE